MPTETKPKPVSPAATQAMATVSATSLTPMQAAMPEWLRSEAPAGLETLTNFIVPPRLKIVQKTSRPPLDKLDAGTVVVTPQMDVLAAYDKAKEVGQPFFFVPVFFFVEWCCWNPLESRGQLDTIRERSFDPASIVAQNAKNPKLRAQVCPEMPKDKEGKPLFIRYVEHLNFIVVVLGNGPQAGIPVVMSFARAEHFTGSTFCALAKFRNAPLFSGQYFAQVGKARVNSKGSWHGFDLANPPADSGVSPFVPTQELFVKYKTLHEEMAAAHKSRTLQVDYSDDAETIVEGAVVDSKGEL